MPPWLPRWTLLSTSSAAASGAVGSGALPSGQQGQACSAPRAAGVSAAGPPLLQKEGSHQQQCRAGAGPYCCGSSHSGVGAIWVSGTPLGSWEQLGALLCCSQGYGRSRGGPGSRGGPTAEAEEAAQGQPGAAWVAAAGEFLEQPLSPSFSF